MKKYQALMAFLFIGLAVCCKKPESKKPDYRINNSEDLLNTTPKNYSGPEIVRLAWGSIPEELSSQARFQELKDAGFSHNFHYYMSGTSAVQSALDIAQSLGIKMIITCNDLFSNPEGTANLFKNHPALWGYYVSDEPANEAKIIEAGQLADRLRAVDPAHPCYLNLAPGGLYNDYGGLKYLDILGYCEKYFKPEMFSFDNYPIRIVDGESKITVSNTWYDNLEVVSSYARSKSKPFWAFVLSVPHKVTSKTYPTPTLAHMRLQAFSDLAYGAQGIQYFTYWQPKSGSESDEQYYPGPIALDGTKTPIYDLVKTVNKEIRDLSFVFINGKVNWVKTINISQTEQKNTFPLEQADLTAIPVSSILAEAGCLVSQIENGTSKYLVIVNYSFSTNQIKLSTKAPLKRVLKNGAEVEAEERINILGGDMVVYKWE